MRNNVKEMTSEVCVKYGHTVESMEKIKEISVFATEQYLLGEMNKEQVCAFIENKTLNRHDAALCGMAVGALTESSGNDPSVQALLTLKKMLKEMKPDE